MRRILCMRPALEDSEICLHHQKKKQDAGGIVDS